MRSPLLLDALPTRDHIIPILNITNSADPSLLPILKTTLNGRSDALSLIAVQSVPRLASIARDKPVSTPEVATLLTVLDSLLFGGNALVEARNERVLVLAAGDAAGWEASLNGVGVKAVWDFVGDGAGLGGLLLCQVEDQAVLAEGAESLVDSGVVASQLAVFVDEWLLLFTAFALSEGVAAEAEDAGLALGLVAAFVLGVVGQTHSEKREGDKQL